MRNNLIHESLYHKGVNNSNFSNVVAQFKVCRGLSREHPFLKCPPAEEGNHLPDVSPNALWSWLPNLPPRLHCGGFRKLSHDQFKLKREEVKATLVAFPRVGVSRQCFPGPDTEASRVQTLRAHKCRLGTRE